MNLVDKVLFSFSPKRVEQRLLSRIRIKQAQKVLQSYDGATTGRRGANWARRNTSANTEIRSAASTLKARARHLVRNDPLASHGQRVLTNNVIGSGIQGKINNKRVQKKWNEWAETTDCDADGLHNIYGLQALVSNGLVSDGEVLVRRRYRKSSDRLPVPMQIQILESDHFAHSKDGDYNGNKIVQGKEYNALGRVVAYWLYTEHPGDSYRATTEIKRYPADEILHIYRVDRPGQGRGVSWFAPAIVKLQDFSEYDDAQLLKQKISSMWVGFTYSDGLGGETVDLPTELESGAIEDIGNRKIEFPDPPTTGDYSSYSIAQKRIIAGALGLSYEVFSGDWSQANFASGRMGWIEMHRNIQTIRRQIIIPQFCQGVFSWFLLAGELAGLSGNATATWVPPRREMLDPVKETSAGLNAIQSGMKPLTTWLRENGDDAEVVLSQYKEDQDLLDKYGLKLKSDYRNELTKTEGNNNAEAVSTEKED